MLKSIKLKKIHIVAVLLCIIMTFSFCMMGFTTKYASADTLSEEEVLNSYLSNNNVSDDYMSEVDDVVVDMFYEYLYIDDNGHLAINSSELILRDDFDSATLNYVTQNIMAMNAIVDEGVAYIDENFELQFLADDEFMQQWATWGFKLSWNKISVNMDKDYAILFSALCIVANVSFNVRALNSLAKTLKDGDDFIIMLNDAYSALPSGTADIIFSYFNDKNLATLVNTLSLVVSVISAGSVFKIVLDVLLPLIIPSLTDSVIVLYNACRYNKGIYLKFCWLPWFGDKWGLSINSI